MIKKWSNSNINLGILKPYQKLRIIFECKEDLYDAVTVITSCGCSQGYIDGNSVVVTFNSDGIPKHLSNLGNSEVSFSKSVKVYYRTGEKDILTFYGKIKV